MKPRSMAAPEDAIEGLRWHMLTAQLAYRLQTQNPERAPAARECFIRAARAFYDAAIMDDALRALAFARAMALAEIPQEEFEHATSVSESDRPLGDVLIDARRVARSQARSRGTAAPLRRDARRPRRSTQG